MTDNPKYGVWLAGKGWLKNKENQDAFADYNREVVQQVAELVGGECRFIDQSIIDFEALYLAQERRAKRTPKESKKAWHIFKIW